MSLKIIKGHCLDILSNLNIDPARCVVMTDPPYGEGLENHDPGRGRGKWGKIAGDQDQEIGLQVMAWADALELPVGYFASPWHPWPGYWRNMIVWDKGGAVGGGGDTKTTLKRTWELIQVKNNRHLSGRYNSVWQFYITPQDLKYHIAQKPVALLVKMLKTFVEPGATVIDPFMGSGSMALASLETGHPYIGIELVPEIFETAQARIQEAEKLVAARPRLPLC